MDEQEVPHVVEASKPSADGVQITVFNPRTNETTLYIAGPESKDHFLFAGIKEGADVVEQITFASNDFIVGYLNFLGELYTELFFASMLHILSGRKRAADANNTDH